MFTLTGDIETAINTAKKIGSENDFTPTQIALANFNWACDKYVEQLMAQGVVVDSKKDMAKIIESTNGFEYVMKLAKFAYTEIGFNMVAK